jgi:acetyl-CoA acetyltransferase
MGEVWKPAPLLVKARQGRQEVQRIGEGFMTDAVIVSTARTPLCKSWRGALNMTHGAKMGGHVVHAALERAKIEPQEVEDVIMGCATPEGATGGNIARQIAIRAGAADIGVRDDR